jgi:hypothetical protein
MIRVLTENEPRLGPLGIRARLEQAAKQVGDKVNKDELGPIPSLRTIGRLQRQFRPLPEEERRPYRLFRWPESMETGALPWEASRSALELLRHRHRHGMGRPLVGVVRWFWRLSEIAPDADIRFRNHAAMSLHSLEGREEGWPMLDRSRRAIEWWLAYRPWGSDAKKAAYDAALRREEAETGDPSGAERPPRFPDDVGFDIGRGREDLIFIKVQ